MTRFVSRVKEVERRLERGTRRGLFLAANNLRNEAQLRTPVDTGFLRGTLTAIVGPDTGVVTGGTRTAETQASITLKPGQAVVGTGAEYARIVHETHATLPKFLEGPAKQMASELQRTIVTELRKAMQ